jgi:hypothetical protein
VLLDNRALAGQGLSRQSKFCFFVKMQVMSKLKLNCPEKASPDAIQGAPFDVP